MIDLILYASNRAALVRWGQSNPPARPLITAVEADDGGVRMVPRKGLEWSPWAGTGQFQTSAGEYDGDTVITPPTYAPGYVIRMRIHGEFFDWDRLEASPEDPDDIKEWERSKVAQYIRQNGTPGTMGGVPYYEIDGVRILRDKDVRAFLASRNLPNHVFL